MNLAGVDLVAWQADLKRAEAALLTAPIDEFEKGINEHLKGLQSSHVAFYHGLQAKFLPQHSINATLKIIGRNKDARWMFLDVFPEGPAAKAGIGPGQVLVAIDRVPAAPPEMPVLKTGRDYNLTISEGVGGASREVTVRVPFRKGTKQRPPIVEPVPVTGRMAEGNVGVLRIPYFSGAAGMRFGKALSAAIEDLKRRGCDSLIVDLRGNIGGSLGFSILASYLCPDKRPIGYSITPKSARLDLHRESLPRVPMPKTRLSLVARLAEYAFRDKSVVLLTQGLGSQPFHGRIAVLVNEWTSSAGEMVASFAKEHGLATVVGTKTQGKVLGAANFKVGADYFVRLPIFGWMTWGGECLERTGVSPDICVDEQPQLLARGVDMQMDRAMDAIVGASS